MPLGPKKKKERQPAKSMTKSVCKRRKVMEKRASRAQHSKEIASRVGNGKNECALSVTVSMALVARDRLNRRTWPIWFFALCRGGR